MTPGPASAVHGFGPVGAFGVEVVVVGTGDRVDEVVPERRGLSRRQIIRPGDATSDNAVYVGRHRPTGEGVAVRDTRRATRVAPGDRRDDVVDPVLAGAIQNNITPPVRR